MVYKVRVNYLLEQLSPWNVKKHSSDDVNLMVEQLWECLQYVKVRVSVICQGQSLCNMSWSESELTQSSTAGVHLKMFYFVNLCFCLMTIFFYTFEPSNNAEKTP